MGKAVAMAAEEIAACSMATSPHSDALPDGSVPGGPFRRAVSCLDSHQPSVKVSLPSAARLASRIITHCGWQAYKGPGRPAQALAGLRELAWRHGGDTAAS